MSPTIPILVSVVCVTLILAWGVMSSSFEDTNTNTLDALWIVSGYFMAILGLVIIVLVVTAVWDVTDYKTFRVAMNILMVVTGLLTVCVGFRVYYVWSGRTVLSSQLVNVSLPVSRALNTAVAVLLLLFCVAIGNLCKRYYISPTTDEWTLMEKVRVTMPEDKRIRIPDEISPSDLLTAVKKYMITANPSLLRAKAEDAVINLLVKDRDNPTNPLSTPTPTAPAAIPMNPNIVDF